jgi:hypothetical protein
MDNISGVHLFDDSARLNFIVEGIANVIEVILRFGYEQRRW